MIPITISVTAPRRNPYVMGLRNWSAVMGALLLREIWYWGESKWTLFMLVMEPAGVIAVFGSISYFLLRQPPYGPSTVLFHATGILPYYFFAQISARTRRFTAESDTRLPCIHPLDEFLTLVLLEVIIMSFASVAVLGGLALFDLPLAAPYNPWACITAAFLVSVFACGFALVNAAITQVVEAWSSVLIISNRGMFLISGVFFVTDFMPPEIRWWLNLNPLSHGIMWFRKGVFPTYPTYSLDRNYLIVTAVSALLIGLIAERAMRNVGVQDDSA